MNKLAIVVPCYNEEEVLHLTILNLTKKLNSLIDKNRISTNSKIIFVNDGSSDNTWNIIEDAAFANSQICGIRLAGNVGHQNALLAGLEYSADKFDICISIDADLQDDINAIDDMLSKYSQGADIVYGVRTDRTCDSFFKKFAAESFYKLLRWMGVKTIYNHADFRLMSSRAVKALLSHPERNVYLRGLVPTLGFNTDTSYYTRNERLAGTSKYSFKKMLSLAWDGISSFTVRPINFILFLGLSVTVMSILITLFSIFVSMKNAYPLTTVLILGSIWFLGGVQLLSVGIIGQYIGKTYTESKRRPRYIIQEVVSNEENF